MKMIGVACSGRTGSASAAVVQEFLRGAEEKGHQTELYVLKNGTFGGCTGCHACKKEGMEGCVLRDALTPYFASLPDVDVVIFGAGNYMGWPQGQAWDFMHRHFSLNRQIHSDCRIPAGKKLIPVFSQGVPNVELYRERYTQFVAPFKGWGFEIQPALVTCGPRQEEMKQAAYEMGKAL